MDNNLKLCLIFLSYLAIVVGWKAVPANQANFGLRSITLENLGAKVDDVFLRRDKLNHIYKFGWCTIDSVRRQFLRKSVNVTLPTWQSTQGTFLYLVAKKNTQNFPLQCVVMKTYVANKFLFYKSRLPLYYCQGILFVLMLNTINRYELHEFFFYDRLYMPVNFSFEFYHPTIL